MKEFLKRTSVRLAGWGRQYLGINMAPATEATAQSTRPFTTLAQISAAFDFAVDPPAILYFGDSVVERVAREDADKRTLGEMFTDRMGRRFRTLVASHSAYNSEMYRELLSVVTKMSHSPTLVIVPINMRSFSPQWYLNPHWQFGQEHQALKQFAPGHPVEIRLAHYEPTQNDMDVYDATPVVYPCTDFNRIGHFRLVVGAHGETEEQRSFRLRQIFIFHYMHELVSHHQLMGNLCQIINIVEDMGAQVVFYVTPINYQAGIRWVGDDFSIYSKKNIDIVRQTMEETSNNNSFHLFDFSRLFDSEYFFHTDLATEHLNEKGRSILTNELAENVTKILPLSLV